MEHTTAEYCPDNTYSPTACCPHSLDLMMAFSTWTIAALVLTLQGDHCKHSLSQLLSNTDVIHAIVLCTE